MFDAERDWVLIVKDLSGIIKQLRHSDLNMQGYVGMSDLCLGNVSTILYKIMLGPGVRFLSKVSRLMLSPLKGDVSRHPLVPGYQAAGLSGPRVNVISLQLPVTLSRSSRIS